MAPAPKRIDKRNRTFPLAVIGLVIATLTGGFLSTPAWAQGHDRRGGHEMRRDDHRGYHRDDRLRHYGDPGYVYAPPPVYYAPPPGPPVVDFVFPLSFR